MAEKKKVRRFVPLPAYEVEELQRWLERLAGEGLLLDEEGGIFAGVATFRRGTPRRVRYRLEPAKRKLGIFGESGPDEEARELARECGWEYVDYYGQFFIFRTFDPGAREMNTDAEVHALSLEYVRKRQRGTVIELVLWLIVYPLLYFRNELPVLVIGVGSWFFLLSLAIGVLEIVTAALRLVSLSRLKKRILGADGARCGPEPGRKAAAYHGGNLVRRSLIAVWAVLLLIMWNDSVLDEDKIPLEDFTGTVPFATIADFAPDAEYELDTSIVPSSVRVWSDALSPYNAYWTEYAGLTLPSGEKLNGALYVKYHEAGSELVAGVLAWSYLRGDKREKNYEELPPPGFGTDFEALYLNELHRETIVLREGRTVIQATFYPFNEIPEGFGDWKRIIADSIKLHAR